MRLLKHLFIHSLMQKQTFMPPKKVHRLRSDCMKGRLTINELKKVMHVSNKPNCRSSGCSTHHPRSTMICSIVQRVSQDQLLMQDDAVTRSTADEQQVVEDQEVVLVMIMEFVL